MRVSVRVTVESPALEGVARGVAGAATRLEAVGGGGPGLELGWIRGHGVASRSPTGEGGGAAWSHR